MKFLTEEDLRQEYKKEPFTQYILPQGMRLTPGARQFLNDRGIHFPQDDVPTSRQEVQQGAFFQAQQAQQEQRQKERAALWVCSLERIQADFLQAGTELGQWNADTAQQLFTLERAIAALHCEQEQVDWETLCESCTGIQPQNSGLDLGDCFEITPQHAQMPGARVGIQLHLLRCELRQAALYAPDEQKEKLNRIINRLSQMICHSFGGKTCQRKTPSQNATDL